MKTRWHHLVTYAASHCLPPPQPQLMSMPLSHCLVDCHLCQSSSSSSARAFLLLLHPFSVKAAYLLVSCHHRLRLPPTSTVFCLIVVYWQSASLFVIALSLFQPLLLFDGAAAALSVNLSQPSSTSSSKPPLPPTLTNNFLFYCFVLFRCRVISPSSSGSGHPAHHIPHHRRCHHLSLSSFSWLLPLLTSSSLSSSSP